MKKFLIRALISILLMMVPSNIWQYVSDESPELQEKALKHPCTKKILVLSFCYL